jgi:hypothetical protein
MSTDTNTSGDSNGKPSSPTYSDGFGLEEMNTLAQELSSAMNYATVETDGDTGEDEDEDDGYSCRNITMYLPKGSVTVSLHVEEDNPDAIWVEVSLYVRDEFPIVRQWAELAYSICPIEAPYGASSLGKNWEVYANVPGATEHASKRLSDMMEVLRNLIG